MAVGGSLAGEITTWMRVRYPFIVDMGIAASAPVLGYVGLADQYTWYHAVRGWLHQVNSSWRV